MTITPKPNQHYRLSLDKAIQDYKDGIITATGLVYYAVGIFRAPGQKFRVRDIDNFCTELGINRATFYRAISKLKTKSRLDWEAIAGLDLWIPISNVVEIQSQPNHPQDEHESDNLSSSNVVELQAEQRVSQSCETLSPTCETLSPTCETLSPTCETLSPTCETLSPTCETLSPTCETQSPEPLSDSNSDAPSYSSQSSYQMFINSLSFLERESFEKFALDKAKRLPNPPTLPQRWVEVHFEELRSQWEKSQGKVSATQANKWENHPQREEWLNIIRTLGYASFFAQVTKDAERKQRIDFYDWAYANDLIWGVES
ncbi:hypothetical protein [Trichormus variabilis]|uniref:Uncharacterized protein n=1 Tax=Trichormus variabilis SAG 1403-4b TaxID=447716 RepID=A0A433UGS1_ANAVA|nr:hypothetical protein [Trichormus variabilis]MBD2629576.1 hypothetical protein [Trichormus variabilis FACHB-164]RUS93004.1 hypothetical protein DSM107003_47510 [Trichormus variabilis SAG 1403-4b]